MLSISMNIFSLPNLLSASRLILGPLAAWSIIENLWLPAAVALMTAIATDLLDGWLARRWQQTSALGGLIDHGSDAFMVALMLLAEASMGLVPWLLPILVIMAFSQYTLDSKALVGLPLRASKLGRYNGIAYFILAGFPIMQHALGIYLIPTQYFYYIAFVLIATTLISMGERLWTLFKIRSK
jgi:phosphatidylglycerophosphate synthase|tara:strand:- start:15145 stop:15693 length:549 start_codon:yes stop_codon:yes gene_type:complete